MHLILAFRLNKNLSQYIFSIKQATFRKMKLWIFIVILVNFRSAVDSIKIDCAFGDKYYSYHKRYTCAATFTNLNENQNVESISGKHSDGKTNEDIEMVDFTKASFIPQELEKFFPNFKVLRINGHTIKELKGNELKNYTKLEFVSIQNGPLKKISGNLFEFTPLMKNVNFANNKIYSMNENFLKSLYKMSDVDFSRNMCVIGNKNAVSSYKVEDVVNDLNAKCIETEAELPITNEDLQGELKQIKEMLERIMNYYDI